MTYKRLIKAMAISTMLACTVPTVSSVKAETTSMTQKVGSGQFTYYTTTDGYAVLELGDKLFKNTNVKQVFIPKTVANIGRALRECGTLESIIVDTENSYLYSEDGVLYRKMWSTNVLHTYPQSKKEVTY